MKYTSELLKEGRIQEIWMRHCGFINLSLEEYMDIQERLFIEQIDLLYESTLGKELLNGSKPKNLEEFRRSVPLTTYEDYAQYLDIKNDEVVPVKPFLWCRSSGRTSDTGPKWVPYTKPMYDLLGDTAIGAMIMSSCAEKGDVTIQLKDRLLLSVAPRPYVSGLIAHATQEQMDVRFLPSLEEGETMEFGDRVAAGFSLAMREGLDYFYGIASVLVRIGEQFEQQSGGTKPSLSMLNPLVLWRLLKAVFKTKIQNRSLLPKDIWKLKGVMAGGTDTSIYMDKIEYYWGRKPLEGYACTEAGSIAIQAWNYKGMVFNPDRVLLEFMPLEEQMKLEEDPHYQPETKMMDELEVGVYELVISNFHGGAFVRYRIGDLFEVISLGDPEIDSELPQFRFYSRNTDVIDLGGIVRLTEKEIWRAVEATGIPYRDWVVRKEFSDGKPNLHLYIEPKTIEIGFGEDARLVIAQYLRDCNPDYRGFEEIMGRDPLVLSLFSKGAFEAYMTAQQEAGADIAHIKPPHMQPTEKIMAHLLQV